MTHVRVGWFPLALATPNVWDPGGVGVAVPRWRAGVRLNGETDISVATA